MTKVTVHEKQMVNEEQPNPAAAHHTITTERRPDNTCSSALARVRSQSTQFMARPICWPQRRNKVTFVPFSRGFLIRMPPTTSLPHPGFYVFILYILQETARLSVCARQVRGSILRNLSPCGLPQCVVLSRYVSSPVAAGPAWSSLAQDLHVSGRHDSGIRTVPLPGTLACAVPQQCGCRLSFLAGLNSDLYHLCGSLHGLDTFWARGS